MNPELEARVTAAHNEITRMCQPGTSWRMCIPVQKDDSDVVLHDTLTALVAEVNRLESALGAIAEQGCIDYRAYPDAAPVLPIEGLPVAECATYSRKPEYKLCPACIANQALNEGK